MEAHYAFGSEKQPAGHAFFYFADRKDGQIQGMCSQVNFFPGLAPFQPVPITGHSVDNIDEVLAEATRRMDDIIYLGPIIPENELVKLTLEAASSYGHSYLDFLSGQKGQRASPELGGFKAGEPADAVSQIFRMYLRAQANPGHRQAYLDEIREAGSGLRGFSVEYLITIAEAPITPQDRQELMVQYFAELKGANKLPEDVNVDILIGRKRRQEEILARHNIPIPY